jgi:hypothetical protein
MSHIARDGRAPSTGCKSDLLITKHYNKGNAYKLEC